MKRYVFDASSFALWFESKVTSSRTVAQTVARLEVLAKHTALDETTFYAFLRTIRSENPRPEFNSTVNKYISAIRNYNEFIGAVWKHPPTRIKEHFRNPDVYSDEEINQIISLCKPKYRLYLKILSHCGLRQGEALSLTKNDINWQTRTIAIRNTKTFVDRIIPIHDSLTDDLKNVQNEQLFNFTDTAVRKEIYRCCDIVRIPKRSMQVFRHSAATRFLNNGENLLAVKQLFGWKKTETVERYYHQSLTQLRHIIENDVLGFISMPATKKLLIIGDRLKNALDPIKQDPDLEYSVQESQDEIVIRVKKKQSFPQSSDSLDSLKPTPTQPEATK